MKKTVSIVFFLFSIYLGYGQEEFSQPQMLDVQPVSPEAMPFLKHTDIDVNEFTGKPNINLPLYTFKLNNFEWPVSISYDAGGLKVEEEASWIGAGWTLNANGLIGRSVKGLPDELGANNGVSVPQKHGYFSDLAKLAFVSAGAVDHSKLTNMDNYENEISGSAEYATGSYLDSIADGYIDLQADLYFYNFGTHSGKFYFDQDQQLNHLMYNTLNFVDYPFKNGMFQYELPGEDYNWTITDNTGITYEFRKTEKTTTISQTFPSIEQVVSEYQSSWYLTKVSIGGEYLIFDYESDYHTDTQLYNESRKFSISGYGTTTSSYSINDTNRSGQRLKSIESSRGDKVEFIAATERLDYDNSEKLDRIVIYKNDEVVKEWVFSHSYFGNNAKLKLDSVREESGNSNLPPYKFTYFDAAAVPETDSKSQDFWGYFNNNSSYTLIPEFKNDLYHFDNQTANREPSFYYTKMGVLTKITYPTGGFHEFEYELNEVYDPDFLQTYFYQAIAFEGTAFNPETDEVIFTVPYEVSATFKSNIHEQDGIGMNTFSSIYKKNSSGSYIAFSGENVNPFAYSNRILLPAGEYKLFATNAGEGGHDEISISIEFELLKPQNKKVGGLRIKTVKSNGGGLSNSSQVKSYYYNDEVDETKSSGVQYNIPYFGGYKSEYVIGGMRTDDHALPICLQDDSEIDAGINVQSYSSNLLTYLGSHVGYENVDIIVRGNKIPGHLTSLTEDPAGKINKKFIAERPFNMIDHPYIDPAYVGHVNGKLKTEIVRNHNNLVLKEKHNYYSEHQYNTNFIILNAYRQKRSFCYRKYPIIYSTTQYRPQYYFKDSAYVVSRDTLGHESHSRHFYQYDKNIIKPVRITSILNEHTAEDQYLAWYPGASDRLKWVAKYQYDNLNEADPFSQALFETLDYRKEYTEYQYNNNQLALKRQWMRNDYPIDFTWAPNRLDSVKMTYDTDTMLEVYKASFGSKSNLIKQRYSQQGDLKKLYQWGYNDSYPIAQLVTSGENEFFKHYNFEADGNTLTSATGFKGMAGQHIISIGNVPAEGSYYVSFKAKKQSQDVEVSLSGGVGGTINQEVTSTNWQYFKRLVGTGSIETTITISIPSGAILDDVSIYSADAELTTFTYDVGKGLSSMTDTNGTAQYFEYDALGRLITKKDDNKNVLSKVYYKYKNQAE
ncbi:hypothetical protein GCM10011506_40450 [Marivirga lumbricoides]|uniref:Sugar-binding protein n=1 Tax=Marivirga lumbricoides TaxID=1046115 RepID=A0ABQ1N437_9BACT|nr:hypothetical protein GCM10011506_40450 [Marivirga lumbricoides]